MTWWIYSRQSPTGGGVCVSGTTSFEDMRSTSMQEEWLWSCRVRWSAGFNALLTGKNPPSNTWIQLQGNRSWRDPFLFSQTLAVSQITHFCLCPWTLSTVRQCTRCVLHCGVHVVRNHALPMHSLYRRCLCGFSYPFPPLSTVTFWTPKCKKEKEKTRKKEIE